MNERLALTASFALTLFGAARTASAGECTPKPMGPGAHPTIAESAPAKGVTVAVEAEQHASARPDLVTDFYVATGAGHVEAWNVDPDEYERRLLKFLRVIGALD